MRTARQDVTLTNIFPSKQCSCCGKEIVFIGTLDEYRYKIDFGRSLKYFCSWKCLQASRPKPRTDKMNTWTKERKQDQEQLVKKQLEMILPLHKQGMTCKQIGNEIGLSACVVYSRIRKWRKENEII